MTALQISPGQLPLAVLRTVWADPVPVALDREAKARVDAAADTIARVIAAGRIVYGVNTGFGLLARTRIDATRLAELQRALVLSHSAGTGAPLNDAVVRLTLLLKIASLARGHSGVRYELVDALLKLLNAGVMPIVPSQGSVGASGDLAPLAHLAGVLIGEGEARVGDMTLPAADALARAGIVPLELQAKEGLALLNGTQVSTALSLAGLFACERTFAAALVAGALSVDACLGSDTPFDERIQRLRGHEGQRDAGRMLRELLAGSAIRASHQDCPRVQDPYSLRCQPQVMGACLDQMRHAAAVLHLEANAVSDNPLVFPDSGEVLSGGNFHAEPVALAADGLALAIAEIGALSERRTALLMDTNLSGLPSFLVREGGVNSGFMIAQVTAAALASENKALAVPRSVDSLPTSANQEDHVSMATNAALRLAPMAGNAAAIVAIELLAAAQGVELRAPLATSPRLQSALQRIRREAAFWDRDRAFAPDLARMRALVEQGAFMPLIGAALT
ncbi:MAG TPA: histidine ammonia-lyase [Casimicrobiaceae bacterium]|jgi:histidine ammonia-lyase|nr:histidine ammonia-lyase [Casimicrobiaceae bacterium]